MQANESEDESIPHKWLEGALSKKSIYNPSGKT